ncbi:toll/interleukin-1 receptor domain-containing protein [Dyadobacter subterraneus]|uniref:Toll/interleukin-1 receptor domain-containing protein n=1 Tax=Dyadobacter subterraneus TaxID=2773304 RepID=A0ABR9W924_9BACT|nr:toll/interleukin-1 receptor domain-containing protein [Dyadobacter subterraneus]MBE9461913.1 toll/interleukin-1 receptor domain-containing protein [Dyadobacter subterraneus]
MTVNVNNPEIYISYSWEAESEKVIEQLNSICNLNGVKIVRDKTEIGFKGLISAFMKRLGKSGSVVLLLSDKYLKSENCMFELLEIVRHGNFYDRIFPIVLSSAKFYKPIDRIKYLSFWEKEIDALNNEMLTLKSQANLQGIRDSLDRYTKFRAMLAELTTVLSDMNNYTLQHHLDTDFAELLKIVLKEGADSGENNISSMEDTTPFFLLESKYETERGKIANEGVVQKITSKAYWEFCVRPMKDKKLNISDIKAAIERSSTGDGWNFPHIPGYNSEEELYRNGVDFLESVSDLGTRKEFWRMYKSGHFIDLWALPEDWYADSEMYSSLNKKVVSETVVNLHGSIVFFITDSISFLSKLFAVGFYKEDLKINLTLKNVLNRKLRVDGDRREPLHNPRITGEHQIVLEYTLSSADIVATHMDISKELIIMALEAFGFAGSEEDIRSEQRKRVR